MPSIHISLQTRNSAISQVLETRVRGHMAVGPGPWGQSHSVVGPGAIK